MIGVGVGPCFGSKKPFSISDLYSASDLGDWGTSTDLSRLFTDTAGTTPITSSGQTAARWDGNRGVVSLRSAGTTNRATYTQSGATLWMAFDGGDGYASAATLNLSTTDKVTIWAAVQKTSDAAQAMLMELSGSWTGNAGSFSLTAPENAVGNSYSSAARGAAAASGTQRSDITGAGAPDTAVLIATHDISGDSSILRRNGVAGTTASGDKGSGNFGNHSFNLGWRGGSLPFTGRIYEWGVIGRILTASEITKLNTYLSSRLA